MLGQAERTGDAVSISIRIGSACFFFFDLLALMIFTDLVGLGLVPIATLPKFRVLGVILSLPATGVGVAVGVAVRAWRLRWRWQLRLGSGRPA